MRFASILMVVLFCVSSFTLALAPATAPVTVDPQQCLSDGFSGLVAGEYREALTVLLEGIKSLGPLPYKLEDKTAIDLFHCAALASIRLGELPSAKRFMDRVKLSADPDRSVILNEATIEVQMRSFSMHAVQILDTYCTNHPTDQFAMDLFGVAIDRAASDKNNARPLAPHVNSYLSSNAKLEETNPSQRRWGTTWVRPTEYHEKSVAHDEAVSECDRDKQALAYAQTNLQTQQNAYDQANNAALFSRQSVDSRNQAMESLGTAKAEVDKAQDAVDAAQRQLDAATANIPMPSWTCDLLGVLPADLPPTATGMAPGAIATPHGGKPVAVAFVVDCSGSMLTCMPLMKQEMGEAINNLSTDQRFGIFAQMSTGIKSMSNDLIAATDENKSKAAAFIEPLQAGGGGQPDQALRVAASFGPDTVWLLTDGDMDTPNTLMQVVHGLPASVRVNTAVLSRYHKETSKQLVLQVAADTNGICIDDTGKRLPLPPKTGEQPVPSLPKGHSIFDSP